MKKNNFGPRYCINKTTVTIDTITRRTSMYVRTRVTPRNLILLHTKNISVKRDRAAAKDSP